MYIVRSLHAEPNNFKLIMLQLRKVFDVHFDIIALYTTLILCLYHL